MVLMRSFFQRGSCGGLQHFSEKQNDAERQSGCRHSSGHGRELRPVLIEAHDSEAGEFGFGAPAADDPELMAIKERRIASVRISSAAAARREYRTAECWSRPFGLYQGTWRRRNGLKTFGEAAHCRGEKERDHIAGFAAPS